MTDLDDDYCEQCSEKAYRPDCDQNHPCPYNTTWMDESYDEYWEDDEDYNDWGDPCDPCDMSCEHWGGDGICLLAIDMQEKDEKEYAEKYTRENTRCPVCGNYMTQFHIPTDKLWQWPGGRWEFAGNGMLGLMVYGAYDCAKGVLCKKDIGKYTYFHIWVGKTDNQKLIKLFKG